MFDFQVLPPDQPDRLETNRISKQPLYQLRLLISSPKIASVWRTWKLNKVIILSSFSGTSKTIYRKPNFLSSIQVLKFYHQYLHNNGPGEWFWHLNGHGNQSNNNDFVKNLNFYFLDLTVTFGNFYLNTCDCSHKTI